MRNILKCLGSSRKEVSHLSACLPQGVKAKVLKPRRTMFLLVAVSMGAGLSALHLTSAHTTGTRLERAHTVLAKELPVLDGTHLKLTLVEVNYGPGESSPPHSHPCAVIAYVVEGNIRSQVEGEAETSYRAGQSFYEAPNGVHLVSANASSTKPAKLLAYLLCDREGPLSKDVPMHHQKDRDRE